MADRPLAEKTAAGSYGSVSTGRPCASCDCKGGLSWPSCSNGCCETPCCHSTAGVLRQWTAISGRPVHPLQAVSDA